MLKLENDALRGDVAAGRPRQFAHQSNLSRSVREATASGVDMQPPPTSGAR